MSDTDIPTMADLATDLAEDVKDETVETQETTTEESSTEDNKAPEVAEQKESEEGQSESEDSEAKESEEQSDTEDTQTEEQPQGKAEERKQTLNGEIRDLVSERNNLRTEVERLNSQVYAPESVEDIMENTGQSQAEARITAMEQRQELSDYNSRVAEAQLVIGNESERVLSDFPMFNPDSPDFNPAVADQAATLLSQNLLVDPNTGQVIGSNVSPYQLYKTIASASQVSAVENQIKGRKASNQEFAAAEPQSSAAPKQPKEDPFLAGLTKGYGDRLAG